MTPCPIILGGDNLEIFQRLESGIINMDDFI